MELKRVVVTGLGAVTPVGNTPEETWEKMIDECTHLSEKQEMLVEQMCTDIADVIESEGVFYE